jgi:hypothetical protein
MVNWSIGPIQEDIERRELGELWIGELVDWWIGAGKPNSKHRADGAECRREFFLDDADLRW